MNERFTPNPSEKMTKALNELDARMREYSTKVLVAILREAYKRDDDDVDLVIESALNELERRLDEQEFVALCQSLDAE